MRAANVNCQRFSVVALLLCGDSAGPMERIWSAQRVRGLKREATECCWAFPDTVTERSEGLTHPSRLHRPSERGERQRRRQQQQREGCSCGVGSVGVDSGYGPARCCRPARGVMDLPAAALAGRGRAFPSAREKACA
ncbi:uncharacterized protein LOC141732247 isoform X4 [Larus michahellis]|uniref:uncharacterized protein LOC141732247 isoform X4 n=1 Tax=Larus michahellis TaxID=119627 RepID=UPI003D9AF436